MQEKFCCISVIVFSNASSHPFSPVFRNACETSGPRHHGWPIQEQMTFFAKTNAIYPTPSCLGWRIAVKLQIEEILKSSMKIIPYLFVLHPQRMFRNVFIVVAQCHPARRADYIETSLNEGPVNRHDMMVFWWWGPCPKENFDQRWCIWIDQTHLA